MASIKFGEMVLQWYWRSSNLAISILTAIGLYTIGGLDWWTDRFSFKTHIRRLYNEVQWTEIAPIVETLGLSWFYCPRLSTTPTIVAQSAGKNETEFQVIVRLVAPASTETIYLLIPVAVSALSPQLPPPSTSCSMLGGPNTDLKLWASYLL